MIGTRIFGIGLSRTGTSTLTEALTLLGFPSVHWPHGMEEIHAHQAATDITVACRYEELDRMYPSSKFILTQRDLPSWIESCIWHYRNNYGIDHLPAHQRAFAWDAEQRIYGAEGGTHLDRARYRDAYISHSENVTSYFKTRPKDLLQITFMEGTGWDALCRFLECPVPKIPFPHLNRRT